MHKCDTCHTNPVADDEQFCSTCNRAMDSYLDGLLERLPPTLAQIAALKPLHWRCLAAEDNALLTAYAVDARSALKYIHPNRHDRFVRISDHQYQLVDSISVAVYLIPDHMMTVV